MLEVMTDLEQSKYQVIFPPSIVPACNHLWLELRVAHQYLRTIRK